MPLNVLNVFNINVNSQLISVSVMICQTSFEHHVLHHHDH